MYYFTPYTTNLSLLMMKAVTVFLVFAGLIENEHSDLHFEVDTKQNHDAVEVSCSSKQIYGY